MIFSVDKKLDSFPSSSVHSLTMEIMIVIVMILILLMITAMMMIMT